MPSERGGGRNSRATALCLGRDASMSRDRTLSLPNRAVAANVAARPRHGGERGVFTGPETRAPSARMAGTPLRLENPVEHELEIFVAGFADPAAVVRHVAFVDDALLRLAAAGRPAELTGVRLEPRFRRPVRLGAPKLFPHPN